MTESYSTAHQQADQYSAFCQRLMPPFQVLQDDNFTFTQGHYLRGYLNPNTYFRALHGSVLRAHNGYANMEFYNADGEKRDQLIHPMPGIPTSVNLQGVSSAQVTWWFSRNKT